MKAAGVMGAKLERVLLTIVAAVDDLQPLSPKPTLSREQGDNIPLTNATLQSHAGSK